MPSYQLMPFSRAVPATSKGPVPRGLPLFIHCICCALPSLHSSPLITFDFLRFSSFPTVKHGRLLVCRWVERRVSMLRSCASLPSPCDVSNHANVLKSRQKRWKRESGLLNRVLRRILGGMRNGLTPCCKCRVTMQETHHYFR